ncbi:MAG: 3'-5' exonuclease [Flammeovirgaceae bacterium]|nr:3'-5' exonuclease [Flammeovirgaceae bacterium]
MTLLDYFWRRRIEGRCKGGKMPDFICDYLGDLKKGNAKENIERAGFVVFDTETTGLDVNQDGIISIGAVKIEGGMINIGESMEWRIDQKVGLKAEGIKIHGIMKKELSGKTEESEALKLFLQFIKGNILVAHHSVFDLAMINKVLKMHFNIKLWNKSIDTAQLARRLEEGKMDNSMSNKANYSLDKLCEKYQIPVFERHNSAGDAYLTAVLFLKLMKLGKRRGLKTIADYC